MRENEEEVQRQEREEIVRYEVVAYLSSSS